MPIGGAGLPPVDPTGFHASGAAGPADGTTGASAAGSAAGAAAGAAASAPAPHNGWPVGNAPNGRVLGFDLSRMDEDELLRGNGKAAIYAVGAGPDDFHPEREPLILVHGIRGEPSDLQALVDRFKSDDYQIYVVTYDDYNRRTSLNGDDLGEELNSLRRRLGAGRDITMVAHSMGGIVARRALNRVASQPAHQNLSQFGRVRLFGADVGWSGYGGPPDEGIGAMMMAIARPFMPDGIEDMRAAAHMFVGDDDSRDPVERAGLYGVALPPNVEIEMAFAQSGDQVRDYTEEPLKGLPRELVRHFEGRYRVRGSRQLRNFWKAIQGSTAYAPLRAELEACAARGDLTEAHVRAALERHLPRFPGNHVGILHEQTRARSYLDHLADRLGTP